MTSQYKNAAVHSRTHCAMQCYKDSPCKAFVVKQMGHRMECGLYSAATDNLEEDVGSMYGPLSFAIIDY